MENRIKILRSKVDNLKGKKEAIEDLINSVEKH